MSQLAGSSPEDRSPTPGPAGEAVEALSGPGSGEAPREEVRMNVPQTRRAAPGARAVHEQIAHVARQLGEGTVEIRLSPEELGRVRMLLQPREDGMTVVLTVERPETLDLMRRHAADLGRALSAAGYDSVDLSFSGGGPRHEGPARAGCQAAPGTEEGPAPETDGPGNAPRTKAGPVTDGLDLRL